MKRSVSIKSISYAIKLVNIAFQSMPCIHAEWAILGGRFRNAGLSVKSGNTLLTVACEYCWCAPSDFVCHAGLAIRQPPCSITRDIVVNGQQKLSNSSSHTQLTMLYVIIIQELTGYCKTSHQLFNRTITNRAESLRNYFAQLTGSAVNLSCQNPKSANSEAILFLIS